MASKKSGQEKEATPSPLGAFLSPSAFFTAQRSQQAATLNFTGEEDNLPPLRDVFDNGYVQHLPRGGWKCLYCNKEWKSINITCILCHFVKTDEKGITVCTNNTRLLTKKRQKRFQDLFERSQNKKRKFASRSTINKFSFNSIPETPSLPTSSLSALSQSNKSSKPLHITVPKKINSRFDRNQMTLENSWSSNGDNITEAIATFVHSSGLPFSIVERDFRQIGITSRLCIY